MNDVRKDVAAILNNGSSSNNTPITPQPSYDDNDNFSSLIGLLRKNSSGTKVEEL